MFLCRENELLKLNRRYESKEAECVIVYGRRRVGKTALINEFVKDKPVIYFSALKAGAKDNLEALSKSVFTYKDPEVSETPFFHSFDAVFSEITRLAKGERLIFVIDEFPYLVYADESIPSRLQHLLDKEWKESGIFLILCGSSMSFMEKEVLSEKSPLFGRRTAQFRIQPLDYHDTAKFVPELSSSDKALVYGITGGVPHYIKKLGVKTDIKDALLYNLFDTSSYLFEEPENLLRQELREPALYNSIITAVAGGASKLNEISTKTDIDIPVCSKYLKTLSGLGIIKKTEPMLKNSQRKSFYRVSDMFFRFWYRFVPGNMSAITSGSMENVYDISIEAYLPEYMGYVFEKMCRQYLVYHAKNLPFNIGEIGEWWGGHPVSKKEIQLDILATEAKGISSDTGRKFIVGSCKYKNEKIGKDEFELIKDYASTFTNAHDDCYYYIFSKAGFKKNLIELSKEYKLKLISLEDMYS